MNNAGLRKRREAVYSRVVIRVIRALVPFLGTKVTPESLAAMFQATKPSVVASRIAAQSLAYHDYVEFVNNKSPVAKLELNRFTDELWSGSLAKAAPVGDTVTVSVVEKIGMSADYWSRDAEWGQRVDSAKKDPRVFKVARVDFEPPSCPFCTLLNSRGPVFLSMDTAARTLHLGDQCTLVYVARGQDDYPGKASSDEALERYKAAREAAPNGSPEAIMAELGKQHPNRPDGRVRQNAKKAAEDARASELRAVKARLARLEKTNPVSESAKKFRADQIELNRKQLAALEAT